MTNLAGESARVPALFANRSFRDLMIGQAISGVGDWMATIASMALVLRLTGSSTAAGGILVPRLVPTLVGRRASTRAVLFASGVVVVVAALTSTRLSRRR